MANYDYEIVNGRKIRVRPKETVSEIDLLKTPYRFLYAAARHRAEFYT